jgi:hypothetical protein
MLWRMRVAVTLVVVFASAAHADPSNIMLADLGLHVVGVGYQRTVSEHVALQLAAESFTPWTQEDTFFEVQGFVVRARPMMYLRAETPTGWWLSPFAQAGVASASRGSGLGAQYDQARIAGGSARPAFGEAWPTIDGSIGYAFGP